MRRESRRAIDIKVWSGNVAQSLLQRNKLGHLNLLLDLMRNSTRIEYSKLCSCASLRNNAAVLTRETYSPTLQGPS